MAQALSSRSDIAINPSLVDNMPISVLGGTGQWCSRIVSTNVGGVPLHRQAMTQTALLVPAKITLPQWLTADTPT